MKGTAVTVHDPQQQLDGEGDGSPTGTAAVRVRGLWKQFGVFKPQGLSIGAAFQNIWPDLLILFAWLAGSLLLLRTAGQRLVKEMTR